MNITDRFLDSMIRLSKKKLPENVIHQTKMCLVDYISCAYLGQSMISNEIERYLSGLTKECGTAPVIGCEKKTSMNVAALLNGISVHVAELDDGHRYGMMHPGAPVISAMLAIAENEKLEAMQFIKGIVLGYEAAIRLAGAIQPDHKLKGYHTTGTCGTLGAAIGIAVALDYSYDQMKTALSAAATDAAGLLAMMDDNSTLKAYNVGRAAVAAVNAAHIGRTCFVGPDDILGGKRGFFKVTASEIREDFLIEGFEDQYAIELIYRKPYAACRHCHAAIDAAFKNKKEYNIVNKDIKAIEIDTYDLAVKGHDHKEVSGTASAKMSIPYSVAAVLVFGEAGYQQFEEACLHNEELDSLIKKIEVRENDELSKLVPGKRAAIVRIITNDKVYEKRVDYPKGEPENPISEEELESKYYSLMDASGKDRNYSSKLLKHIWNLENDFKEVLFEL